MRGTCRIFSVLAAAAAALAAPLAADASALAAAAPSAAPPSPAGAPTSSDRCGECHRDIYRTWKASAHARSMDEEVFLQAFRETEARDGDAAARTCLRCHAPLAEVTRDWKLDQRVTWEGVSCDVCHSLVSVDMSGFGPRQILDVGPVKRGPIADAASTEHEVAYSELHTTALACAWCHEFANADGTPIMTTYTEWKGSAAARDGRTCQACHMAKSRANVVDPKVARVPRAEVNVHEVPGGHSLEQLHKALDVAIEPRQEGDSLAVFVRLTNKGAGHAVPTGMPGRRVILDLRVRSSTGETFEESRTYGKFFADAEGGRVALDSRLFTKGVRLDSDTRIRSDERRVETFRFPVPARATAFVTLKLHYEHAPTAGAEGRTWLTFYSENRTLVPRSPAGR